MIDGRDAVNSSLRMTRRNIPSAGMNEQLEGRKGLTNDSPTVLQSTDPCTRCRTSFSLLRFDNHRYH